MKCLWLTQTAYRTATPPWCNPSGTHDYLAQHTIDPSLHQISEEAPVITCHHLCKIMQNSSYYSFISSISVTVPQWSADICRQKIHWSFRNPGPASKQIAQISDCSDCSDLPNGLSTNSRFPRFPMIFLQRTSANAKPLATPGEAPLRGCPMVPHGAPWCYGEKTKHNKTLLHGSIWILGPSLTWVNHQMLSAWVWMG